MAKAEPLPRSTRLAIFLERLAAAPPASTASQAKSLLARILNEVEDEFSGIVFDPDMPLSDGRMYPPREDNRRNVHGRSDVVRYRSKAHNTYISNAGAIRIEDIEKGADVLDKAGKNGRTVGKI